MGNPLTKQVDGNHYTEQLLQPIEAAYLLNATPCWTKLNKYLTRDKGNKLSNLNKALHCIELEEYFEEGFDERLAEMLGFEEDTWVELLGLEEDPCVELKGLSLSSLGYSNRVCDEFLENIVALCTDNEKYRGALKAMYKMNYRSAKDFVASSIRDLTTE